MVVVTVVVVAVVVVFVVVGFVGGAVTAGQESQRIGHAALMLIYAEKVHSDRLRPVQRLASSPFPLAQVLADSAVVGVADMDVVAVVVSVDVSVAVAVEVAEVVLAGHVLHSPRHSPTELKKVHCAASSHPSASISPLQTFRQEPQSTGQSPRRKGPTSLCWQRPLSCLQTG